MRKKTDILRPLALLTVIVFCGALALAEERDFPPRVNPGRLASVKLMKNPVSPDGKSIAAGKEIYFGKGLCANCHGDAGKGDGPGGKSFDPEPRDFTNASWQKVRTDGEIFIAITEGTQFGMIAFGDNLTEEDRWDLVNYLRTFGGAPAEEDFPSRVNPGRLASVKLMKNPVSPDGRSIAAGKEIYFGKGLCANCHGDAGRGNGPGGASLVPGPRDFTSARWQKVRTDGEIFIAITEGTQFGMMAFGDNLTEKERWDLVNYLRTFEQAR